MNKEMHSASSGRVMLLVTKKVCTNSLHKFKYKKQTFWNTNSGGKKKNVEKQSDDMKSNLKK